MTDWAAALRQLRFPRELRIGSASPALDLPDLDEVVRRVEGIGGGRKTAVEEPGKLDARFAARLGTLAWRLQKKLGELPEDNATVWLDRRMQMLESLLKGQGIEVRDFTGRDFDPNEIWEDVIGTEGPKPDPVVVAMHEPRVVLHGLVVQRGKPIVRDRSSQTDLEPEG